ncbi:LysR family transcriptional regulator [Luteolibacter pohnpeiensis]|uniref:LysR family transcriptional regulator n=1 Tax=Luteolibacter pohnpeiensis TaxID=454153 RepID=A0A934SEP3_9BACT|nr:LysR family transcriptional regulator [Luteolibacter pohnpeiensis]MBK1883818.1 LysR family transcriptional regulator [Luteolibacter pohnpeiensis]
MDWVPDLRQLRAFVAVVEEESFTMAARRLFVTQSAVSHSLRALEEQLDCKLLDRAGKRVAVTVEGELLLKRSKLVLQELERASRDLDGLRRWGQTRIRIGAPHTLCHFVVPSVLREFRDCFPRCEPVIEAADTTILLDRLSNAELDLVVGLKPRGRSADGYRPMFKDKLSFVVSPFHPWAPGGEGNRDDLEDQQFIIYAKASETYRLIEEWMGDRAHRVKKPLVLGDMQAIKEMAKLGIGIGIVAPWAAAREIDEGSLIAVEIGDNGISREWGVFHSPKKDPSLVEEAFIGLCEMAFAAMPPGIAEPIC